MNPSPRPVRHSRYGFTLLEIMIVVGIIGALAAVIVPSLAKHQDNVRLKMIEANLRKIEAAKAIWALEVRAEAGRTATADDLDPFDGNPKPVAGETYDINPIGSPATARLASKLGKHAASSLLQLPRD